MVSMPSATESTKDATADPTVLVTGGAGYIGSHAALALEAAGYSLRSCTLRPISRWAKTTTWTRI
ncbi:MAG: NAD-dependent epimerase/dehydratase family protein [Cyanobacteria bacterium J06559_1]